MTALPRTKVRAQGPSRRTGCAPLLISLPHGLDLGGVTTWAVRLANGLVARGRAVALLVHPRNEHQPAAPIHLDERVEVIEPAAFPRLHHAAGDLSPFLPTYRDVIRRLADASGSPVVVSPNILGDSYGLAAALCITDPELLRVLAWQHTDAAYDTWLLQRYEPIVSRFVAIDPRYVRALRARLPHRADDISDVPHGVHVPTNAPDPRPPLRDAGTFLRPVRLVFTGRIDHAQKRITALAYLADELAARSIPHEIVVMGDGPASTDLNALVRDRPSISVLPAGGHRLVDRLLANADAFVLPSRFEGLCISRIEAMAQGCVPIVTSVNTGATHGIDDGRSGLFVGGTPDDDDRTIAGHLAESVSRFISGDTRAMSVASWEAARDRFSLADHLDAVEREMGAACNAPARWWRASWPAAFSFSTTLCGASGSVPSHGPDRMRAKLEELAGRTIVIHGAGRHTLELAAILADSKARIAAVCDDDATRWKTPFLGWSIINPAHASESGATDVILSSWMHVEAVLKRRHVYERQGIAVHTLYQEREAS